MRKIVAAMVAPLLLGAVPTASDGKCQLAATPIGLPESTPLFADPASEVALYSTWLRRDDDGAPNAYSPCGANYADIGCAGDRYGIDHICSGVTVRDATGAIVPPFEQPDPTKPGNSRRCLATFRAAQAANYPDCGRGLPCVSSWPGVVLTRRDAAPGLAARIPLIRSGGPYDGYYISQTTLGRADPSAPGGEAFLDARVVPYVVVPGNSVLVKAPWGFGSTTRADLALVIAQRTDGTFRAVFAVVGETGPAAETGEVSSGLLLLLRGMALGDARPKPAAIPGDAFKKKATVILFRHRADSPVVGTWPARDMTAANIQAAGRLALDQAGGLARFAACAGIPAATDTLEFAETP